MKRLLAMFRPALPLREPLQLWHQVRAWSGLRHWVRPDDLGGRAAVRSIYLPAGMMPAEMRA